MNGKLILTSHAKERIRQRIGLTSEEAGLAWVSKALEKANKTKINGKTTSYITDMYEIILDGVRVVTVKPSEQANDYVTKIGDMVTKEVSKLLVEYKRELRKADVAVAQAQLNFLKAKSPKVKTSIQRKLTEAIDWKAGLEDKIKQVEYAGKRYGVDMAN